MSQERYKDLNLTPPQEGFELYRYKHAERMSTRGWSGLYWARKNEAGDYEIRTVTKEGEGYSYPGDVFSKEAFEILREGRLISAATPSFRSGGNSQRRLAGGVQKSFQRLLKLVVGLLPRRMIPAT